MSQIRGRTIDGSNACDPNLSSRTQFFGQRRAERCCDLSHRRPRFALGSLGIMKWILGVCLAPFLLFASPNTTSVLLLNDSPFILTSTVQASDGSYLGQFTIQPGQQRNFTTNLGPTSFETPGHPDISLTPFSVIWQCPSEGFYGTNTNVAAGSLVRATDSAGPHFCAPKSKPKKEPPASSLRKAQ